MHVDGPPHEGDVASHTEEPEAPHGDVSHAGEAACAAEVKNGSVDHEAPQTRHVKENEKSGRCVEIGMDKDGKTVGSASVGSAQDPWRVAVTCSLLKSTFVGCQDPRVCLASVATPARAQLNVTLAQRANCVHCLF